MPKGGARARSGPAPDPEALRREQHWGEWVDLPSAGRTGRAPAWPLTKATPRERTVWNRLWKLPQAIMWEKQQQHDVVALYVRRFVEAEQRGSPTNLSTLVRQLADSLGLTTPGLRSNRWRISERKSGVTSPSSAPSPRPSRSRSPSKARLKVVQDGD